MVELDEPAAPVELPLTDAVEPPLTDPVELPLLEAPPDGPELVPDVEPAPLPAPEMLESIDDELDEAPVPPLPLPLVTGTVVQPAARMSPSTAAQRPSTFPLIGRTHGPSCGNARWRRSVTAWRKEMWPSSNAGFAPAEIDYASTYSGHASGGFAGLLGARGFAGMGSVRADPGRSRSAP